MLMGVEKKRKTNLDWIVDLPNPACLMERFRNPLNFHAQPLENVRKGMRKRGR